ncbi:hypothetical protein HELRODRAFT_112383 [Helobdella robusta]|uniref:NEDD8-activating enzyme E1 regulatory subunit n=1 Tax=Helobdella robusta TaxID=6412 RepID=T1EFJ4_HELRO|nr:hypothetical protein HELRODRAFT_112383 [Helobdella robusta]ESO03022.1 hypothetical protein HELRODRAFT_112383 [Helobdella robusta]
MTGPNDVSVDLKTQKYDRQLRLWGDHGQISLEAAKICLINANATGTEILKNMVLPGIGSFTIVDSSQVTPEDLGVNFFLTKDCIGKSRAESATCYLKELNSDVVGIAINESLDALIDNSPDFFSHFHLVIASAVHDRTLLKLASILWDCDIPLLVCRSYGFMGYLRLVVKEHTIIESHPEGVIEDLRLQNPFDGLITFCRSVHLDALSLKEHSHVPWLVIIFKYLQTWMDNHGGKFPTTYSEKNEIKMMIKNGRLRRSDGSFEEEENFDEACKNVNTALLPTAIPQELLKLFDDENCLNIHSDSKPFWILLRALKSFVDCEGKGNFPVRGTIPDMTSDTESYIKLQQVYRDQAQLDQQCLSTHLSELLQNIGRPDDCITEEDVSLFCKNASNLRLMRTRSLACEYEPQDAGLFQIVSTLADSDDDEVLYYVMTRAADSFYVDHRRYPGSFDDSLDDVSLFKMQVTKICQELNIPNISDDYIHEFCRFGASEVHAVAAYMGGITAQEAIKLITHQFIPINNLFIYNAIKQTSKTYAL